MQIEVNSSVVGWDDQVAVSASGCATTRPSRSTWRFGGPFPATSSSAASWRPRTHDYQTVEYTATVKPGEKADLLYEVIQHQGRNAKQNNVTIERAAIKP